MSRSVDTQASAFAREIVADGVGEAPDRVEIGPPRDEQVTGMSASRAISQAKTGSV